MWIKFFKKLLGTNCRKRGEGKDWFHSIRQLYLEDLGKREESVWYKKRQISFIIINTCLQLNIYPVGESNFIVVPNKNVQQITYRGFTS